MSNIFKMFLIIFFEKSFILNLNNFTIIIEKILNKKRLLAFTLK